MNWGMKMTNQMPKKDDNFMLDDLFDLASADSEQPSGDLMMRILNDADEQITLNNEPAFVAAPSLFNSLMDMVGGWKAIGGLATATATGLWMGISPPSAFEDFTSDYYSTASVEETGATIDNLLGFDTQFLEEEA